MPLNVQGDHVMDLELDYIFKAKSSIDHSRDSHVLCIYVCMCLRFKSLLERIIMSVLTVFGLSPLRFFVT